jgi:tetratricopeptide (TPR) repeat protein
LAAGFAGWAWTRSDALERATAALDRARSPLALAQAVRLALDHLDRQPWSREAAAIAAVGLSRLDRPDDAEIYYRRLGRLSLSERRARAYALVRANRREEAIAAYRQILDESPEDVEALRLLGGLHFSRREYAAAAQVAKRLTDQAEGASEGHRLLGTIYAEQGDLTAAAEELLKVLQHDPELKRMPAEGRLPFYTYLGRSLLANGRGDEAVRFLEQALREQESPLLRTLLGQARRQLGEAEAADAEWRRALALDPGLGLAWLERGRLALSEGRLDDALTALKQAEALAPDDVEVLFALRNVHTRRGETAEALAVGERLEEARRRMKPRPGGMGPPPVLADEG